VAEADDLGGGAPAHADEGRRVEEPDRPFVLAGPDRPKRSSKGYADPDRVIGWRGL
jgi:hypothetical protein